MMLMQQKFVTQRRRWDGVLTVYVYKWKWYLEVFKMMIVGETKKYFGNVCKRKRACYGDHHIYSLCCFKKLWRATRALPELLYSSSLSPSINFSFQVFQPHRNKQNLTISHSSTLIIFLTSPPYVMMLRWIISLCQWVPPKVW